MTAASPSFPHPADIRGWRLGQPPPGTTREQGSARSRALDSLAAGRKSFARARLIHDTFSNLRSIPLQTTDRSPAGMIKSP
jgi:hypothetical protein